MKPIALSLAKSRLLTTLVTSLALASCAQPPPTARVPTATSLSPKACLTQEWSPSLPSSGPTSFNVLAGGTLTTNDFIIGIWLYCDPSLISTDPFAEEYSEIGKLGLDYEWLYRGQSSESDPRTSVMINGEETRDGGSGPGLQSGDAGGSTGPIETPSRVAARAAAVGQPIEFTVRIDVGGFVTRATLTVLLQGFPEGYRLASASLAVPAE